MKSFRQEIAEAFENSGSDKEYNHSYSIGYAKILFDQKKVDNILEIGLANISIDRTSLDAWTQIYPDASVFGIDIDSSKMLNKGNIKTFNLDQSNFDSLVSWSKDLGVQFDVIIDDGSHIFEHAKTSFQALFNSLAPGGVYIIEDVSKNEDSLIIPNQQMLSDWKDYFTITHGFNVIVHDCKPGVNDDSILIEVRKISQ